MAAKKAILNQSFSRVEDKLLDFEALENAAANAPRGWKSLEVLLVDFEATGNEGVSDGKKKTEKREWRYKPIEHTFWQMRTGGNYWDTGIFNKQLASIGSGSNQLVRGNKAAQTCAKYLLDRHTGATKAGTPPTKGLGFYSFE